MTDKQKEFNTAWNNHINDLERLKFNVEYRGKEYKEIDNLIFDAKMLISKITKNIK